MENLEYKIGGMDIVLDKLKFEGRDSSKASHKFIVGISNGVLDFYIAQKSRHYEVKEKFRVGSWIGGGGSCYLNKENELVLDGLSEVYYSIPKVVAQKFLELMLPELQKLGIEIKGTIANPYEWDLKKIWKDELGFEVLEN